MCPLDIDLSSCQRRRSVGTIYRGRALSNPSPSFCFSPFSLCQPPQDTSLSRWALATYLTKTISRLRFPLLYAASLAIMRRRHANDHVVDARWFFFASLRSLGSLLSLTELKIAESCMQTRYEDSHNQVPSIFDF